MEKASGRSELWTGGREQSGSVVKAVDQEFHGTEKNVLICIQINEIDMFYNWIKIDINGITNKLVPLDYSF